MGGELGQASALQDHRIIFVEVVQPEHALAALKQPEGRMEADEAGSAGDEVGHSCLSATWTPCRRRAMVASRALRSNPPAATHRGLYTGNGPRERRRAYRHRR